jgi:hypothetical protein
MGRIGDLPVTIWNGVDPVADPMAKCAKLL